MAVCNPTYPPPLSQKGPLSAGHGKANGVGTAQHVGSTSDRSLSRPRVELGLKWAMLGEECIALGSEECRQHLRLNTTCKHSYTLKSYCWLFITYLQIFTNEEVGLNND